MYDVVIIGSGTAGMTAAIYVQEVEIGRASCRERV